MSTPTQPLPQDELPNNDSAPGINSYPVTSDSFAILYRGWIEFLSNTFRHIADVTKRNITADIKGGNLYLVLVVQLSPTCSIEVSKVMQTQAGRFTCTGTHVRLMRPGKGNNKPKQLIVPMESMEDKKYYSSFFIDCL